VTIKSQLLDSLKQIYTEQLHIKRKSVPSNKPPTFYRIYFSAPTNNLKKEAFPNSFKQVRVNRAVQSIDRAKFMCDNHQIKNEMAGRHYF